jgi:antitoxin HicB
VPYPLGEEPAPDIDVPPGVSSQPAPRSLKESIVSYVYRVPLVMTPQQEGGFTVTSPALPGLVTEGDTLEQALENAKDALHATLELYEDTGRPVPPNLIQDPDAGAIQFDLLLAAR